MSVDKSNYVIYSNAGLRIKASVQIRNKNEHVSYTFNSNGAVVLQYQPLRSIIIEAGSGDTYDNIFFPVQDYEDICDLFMVSYKRLMKDDMFFFDELDKLTLNDKMARDSTITLPSFGKNISIKPSLVNINGSDTEGVNILINKTFVEFTHQELKKLAKTLNRLDIHNLMVSLSNNVHFLDHISKMNIPNKSKERLGGF